MKRCSLIIILLWAMNILSAADVNIEKLIRSMTLEEKVGQMCQIDLGVIAEGDICQLKIPQELDMQKLETVFSKYYVGSVLNVGCGAGAMDMENWRKLLHTLYQKSAEYQPHHIPLLFGIDAIHGAGYTKSAVLLPQQLAQAATWNPELVQKGYQMTAYETRATGIPWNFSPVLDLGRQVLWSRFFETFGEDIHLAKSMTEAAIRGLQGENIGGTYQVAACMKHFLGYSNPISGKDRTPVYMSDRTLREYYLPTFQKAIELGAATVMINSGEIDGVPVHANKEILTDLLRDELGFEGVAVTDWEDIWKLVNVHHVAKDKKEAVQIAIDAGIDMSMVPNDTEFCDLLIELVREERISEQRIDLSVRRILQLKKDLGLFDQVMTALKDYPDFASPKHKETSYMTAAEAITLLKNEGNTLPVTAKSRLTFCGPGADDAKFLLGAWSRSWQGTDTNLQDKTLWDIAQKECNAQLIPWNEAVAPSKKSLLSNTANSDLVVICLAENPSTEIPGNINSLELPEDQKQLVREIKSLGKKIALLCNFNRPLIITEEVEMADAVVYAYQPGQEGARAIIDVLLAKINPSGKLPFTYPKYSATLVKYDRKHSEDLHIDFSSNAYDPLFDFGHGLSYTSFAYSDLKTDRKEYSATDDIRLTLTVKNTGKRAGQEVIQIYYQDQVASITPSVRKLCAYQKVKLENGESRSVDIRIPLTELSLVNRDLERVVEPGDFSLMVGNLKTQIHVN